MSTKTNKSYTKRIKVTKTGKLKTRKIGQSHFNAKQTGRKRMGKKRLQTLGGVPVRKLIRFMKVK